MKFINQLMASQIGSFLKAFGTAVIALALAKYNEGVPCETWSCLQDLGFAALAATIPVFLNIQNPEYKNYGKKK